MPLQRIIKKYPNRRLYDTESSRYITLADVRGLVMAGTDFKVVDTSNDEDLTRSILLQIMLEEEAGGEPLFSAKMLGQMIRFYGGTIQGVFTKYLEDSLDIFAREQQQLREAFGGTPLEAMSKMARHNMELWAEMQQSILRASGLSADRRAESEREPNKK